ncbi:hypothetical protein D3C81_1152450 [compost metagenome]
MSPQVIFAAPVFSTPCSSSQSMGKRCTGMLNSPANWLTSASIFCGLAETSSLGGWLKFAIR